MEEPKKQSWFHRLRRFNRQWIDRMDPDWPVEESGDDTAPKKAPSPSNDGDWRTFEGERTPNPNALKFCVGQPVQQRTLLPADASPEDPLSPLLAVPGVVSVFAVEDFVTILKGSDASWNEVLPPVRDILKGVFP